MRERVLSWFRELKDPGEIEHVPFYTTETPTEITDILLENEILKGILTMQTEQYNAVIGRYRGDFKYIREALAEARKTVKSPSALQHLYTAQGIVRYAR